ncbi:MAG: GNAT family N-acetyltransferase [Acidimicrobiales bacterium]
MAPDDVSRPSLPPVSPLREGEIDAFFGIDAAAFGARMSRGVEELIRKVMTLDRVAASRHDGVPVGTAASEASVMTVPGLGGVPTAVVVAVAVTPSHRRQGRLRALMRYQLDDIRGRGEAAAVLTASEGGIYGRFGYGQATFGSTYTLDKRVARLARPVGDFASGQVRLILRDEAAEAFPAIYAAYWPTRAGELARAEIDYLGALGEPGGEDLGRRFYAVFEEAGRLDGYVAYEVAPIESPAHHGPRRVLVHELCALTPGSYVALWDFLLGVDLTAELVARSRPVDEPIKWLLAEPRQLRCTFSGDHAWIRLVDAARCLAARRYATAGDLVVDLDDHFCPWNSGRYRLVVAEDWGLAEVSSTPRPADVELDVSALASVYLGGVSPLALAEVGRIRQLSEGSVAKMSRMFANDRPPYCLTHF